jgi:hypothetical protein
MQEKKSDAAQNKALLPPSNVCSVHKNPMTFLFLNVDIFNIYIQKRKGTSMESFRKILHGNLPEAFHRGAASPILPPLPCILNPPSLSVRGV